MGKSLGEYTATSPRNLQHHTTSNTTIYKRFQQSHYKLILFEVRCSEKDYQSIFGKGNHTRIAALQYEILDT